MIGYLPKTLEIKGNNYPIRSDYRVALHILSAFNDPDVNEFNIVPIVLKCLYINDIPEHLQLEAYNKAIWYLNCGNNDETQTTNIKLYDWEQDEQIIFSAINKVAGKEIRELDYMHFWTFVGLFNEIGEGTFSTYVSIRNKKAHHKPLEKWEKDIYKKNRDSIVLKTKISEAKQAELDELTRIFG